MSFLPQMRSETQGFSPIRELRWRRWGSVVADVWDVVCADEARGLYVSPDPRLFVLIGIDGSGSLEITRRDTGECVLHGAVGAVSYVPAGVVIEAQCKGLSRIKHFDLHFSEEWATQRFGKELDVASFHQSRLDVDDGRVKHLALALAEECESSSPLNDRYGEGLVLALLAALLRVSSGKVKRRAGLSRAQLNHVTSIMTKRSFETVRLAELAAEVGLSETHFSHAFKSSTGVSPHRWLMHARIRRVQQMLSEEKASLAEVAVIAGFADQAHLTRAFKAQTGVTPTEWRRRAAV